MMTQEELENEKRWLQQKYLMNEMRKSQKTDNDNFAFSYSMWTEPMAEKKLNITSGKFIYSISSLNVPIIPATIVFNGKEYATDRAMIDTGSTQTIVFSSFIDEINAEPIQTINLGTAGGNVKNKKVYLGTVKLPAGITATDAKIIYSGDKSPAIDVLIGADILSCGVFIYDGPNRRFLFEVK